MNRRMPSILAFVTVLFSVTACDYFYSTSAPTPVRVVRTQPVRMVPVQPMQPMQTVPGLPVQQAGMPAVQQPAVVRSANTAGVPHAQGGELRNFSTLPEALSYAKGRLAVFDTVIAVRLPGVDKQVAKVVADTLSLEDNISSIKTMISSGVLFIVPRYTDESLLLRAYRDPAVEATLNATQRAALARARQIVTMVCQQYGTDYDRAKALHDYLVSHTRYVRSAEASNLTLCTASLLVKGRGICEGYTRAYRLMLNMAGIENRYMRGAAQGISHCWNLVKLEGQWVHVDCTYDDPVPDVAGRVLHSHFAMSDNQIASTHSWNRAAVPAASADNLYYPFRSGLHFATMQDFVNYCCTHPMTRVYRTAFIDELVTSRLKAEPLLRTAERRVGRSVIKKFGVSSSKPGAFSFVCK